MFGQQKETKPIISKDTDINQETLILKYMHVFITLQSKHQPK